MTYLIYVETSVWLHIGLKQGTHACKILKEEYIMSYEAESAQEVIKEFD